jgi:hypothetical protein
MISGGLSRLNGQILLANLLPRDRAAVATSDSPCSWAFNDGICEAQFSALGGSPTVIHEPELSTAHENSGAISRRVSGGFVRLVRRTKKPLSKWLIMLVTGAPRGTTLTPVGRKADCTHIAVGASVLLAHQLSESPRQPGKGTSEETSHQAPRPSSG